MSGGFESDPSGSGQHARLSTGATGGVGAPPFVASTAASSSIPPWPMQNAGGTQQQLPCPMAFAQHFANVTPAVIVSFRHFERTNLVLQSGCNGSVCTRGVGPRRAAVNSGAVHIHAC